MIVTVDSQTRLCETLLLPLVWGKGDQRDFCYAQPNAIPLTPSWQTRFQFFAKRYTKEGTSGSR